MACGGAGPCPEIKPCEVIGQLEQAGRRVSLLLPENIPEPSTKFDVVIDESLDTVQHTHRETDRRTTDVTLSVMHTARAH